MVITCRSRPTAQAATEIIIGVRSTVPFITALRTHNIQHRVDADTLPPKIVFQDVMQNVIHLYADDWGTVFDAELAASSPPVSPSAPAITVSHDSTSTALPTFNLTHLSSKLRPANSPSTAEPIPPLDAITLPAPLPLLRSASPRTATPTFLATNETNPSPSQNPVSSTVTNASGAAAQIPSPSARSPPSQGILTIIPPPSSRTPAPLDSEQW